MIKVSAIRIKPGNILSDPVTGEIKLIDLEISRIRDMREKKYIYELIQKTFIIRSLSPSMDDIVKKSICGQLRFLLMIC